MPKKAIALALSITAIIFCITNIDRRVSAEYNTAPADNSSVKLELEIPTADSSNSVTDLKTLSPEAPAAQPTNETRSAGMDFSLKRLIVRTSSYDALKNYDAKITSLLKDFYVLEFKDEDATRNAFLELSDLESIKSVDPDVNVKPSAVSAEQTAWGVENIGADHYTDWLTLSEKTDNIVKIAVIDSGINQNHLAFKNSNGVNDRVVITSNTKDYVNDDADPDDENGHGTSVAGTIIESTPANVKVYPSKVFDASGSAEGATGITNIFRAIANAVEYDKVDIVNLSLGFDAENESDIIKCSDYATYETFFTEIRNTYKTLVVAAAGNEAHAVSFPANCADVVAVSSVKSDRTFSSDFSNYGPEIDFAMPGEALLLPTIVKAGETVPDPSINSDNAMRQISGTSFASPFLAAAAALIKAENPTYTPAQLIAALKSYAVPLGDSNKFGNGIVDFGAKKFNTPHVYAKASTSTSWAKTSTIKIGAVSSYPINGVAAKLDSATAPTSAEWKTDGVPQNLYTMPLTDVDVDDNGTYRIWFRNSASNSGNATVIVSNIDNLKPNFDSQITFSDSGEDTITINTSVLDSQSGLKKVTIYYRKKGTNDFQTKSTTYSNVTSQMNIKFVLTGLEDATEYEFYLEAEDALGNKNTTAPNGFTTQTTAPISLPDAGNQGNDNPQQPSTPTTPTNPASQTPETIQTSVNNPITLDPVVIYFSGFIGSTMLGFAIYHTIGGRR